MRNAETVLAIIREREKEITGGPEGQRSKGDPDLETGHDLPEA